MKEVPQSTARLSFRYFEMDDHNLIYKLNGNYQVTRFLGGIRTREQARRDLTRYLDYYDQYPGYGYWCTFVKDRNQFVGWFVIKVLPETGEAEIGYRLLPEFWGQGMATEGAKAMIRYGFERLGINRVVGVALPENKASCRVLEKAGLQFQKIDTFYDCRCGYYVLDYVE